MLFFSLADLLMNFFQRREVVMEEERLVESGEGGEACGEASELCSEEVRERVRLVKGDEKW